MREHFEFLEHTADILVRAYGKDYPSALRQAALAMFSTIGELKKKDEEFVVISKEDTKEELVVSFLSSILAECEVRRIVPVDIQIIESVGLLIKAKIIGEKGGFSDHIKAVTFHQLEISEDEQGVRIQVLFDV
jgi:SHS2 domain-containing protein